MEKFFRPKFDFAEQVANLYVETGQRELTVTANRTGGAVEIFAEMVGGTAWTAIDGDDVTSLEFTRAAFETYAIAAITLVDLVGVAQRAREAA